MSEIERIWSFSRLSTYHTCPHSFYRKYILGEKGLDNDWALSNTVAHDVLEMTMKGEIPYENAAQYFVDNTKHCTFDTMKPNYAATHISAITNFLADWKGPKGEVIGIERDFLIDIQGEKLRGFIDLETRTEDGIMLADWKGSAISGFQGKKLKEKARQLQLYSISAKEHWGEKPKRAYFYMLKYKKAIEVSLAEKDIQGARDWMLRTIEEIDNDKTWGYKPSWFFCNQLCQLENCINYGKQ